jgi:hypothetical protein
MRVCAYDTDNLRLIEKLVEIVAPYLDPPAHAVMLSIDENSRIQALDRTQPGCRSGRSRTMTYVKIARAHWPHRAATGKLE